MTWVLLLAGCGAPSGRADGDREWPPYTGAFDEHARAIYVYEDSGRLSYVLWDHCPEEEGSGRYCP